MYKRKVLFGRLFTIYMVLAILIVLLTTFCFYNNTNLVIADEYNSRSGATSGWASVLNLDKDGNHEVSGKPVDNFSSALTGGQNEYIYFGVNPATGRPMLWRVLSANNTKYSANGGILLWADESIGKWKYNDSSSDPDHAFWSNSQMRAKLNGGSHITGSIAQGDSYFNAIFKTQKERDSVVLTNSYNTYNMGYENGRGNVVSDSYYKYYITNLIHESSSSGYYTPAMINSANSNMTNGSVMKGDNNSVKETSFGDYLFLLDYYDINNREFGFVENGKTYAENVMSYNGSTIKWNEDPKNGPSGYPARYDFNNNGTAYMPVSMRYSDTYWLRPAGRDIHGGTSYSCGLLIENSNKVATWTMANEVGVRPGFVFNPKSVIYATASTAGKTSEFGLVTQKNNLAGYGGANKPSYKTFMQAENFTNYNTASVVPTVSIQGNKVQVQKSGQSGTAVILLSSKTGNGDVSYQATCTFNSSGLAVASIPSSITNISNYNINILFCDSYIGGNAMEKVNGVYTYKGIAQPQDTSLVYQDRNIVVADFAKAEDAYWFDADIYTNENIMDVTFVGDHKNVGTCTVNFTLKDESDKAWWDGTKGTKSITLTITQAQLDLSNVVWSDTELEYNAQNQSVTITNLPSYINLTYKDNTQSAVGNYTAQVVDITSTNDNYKVPTTTELANYPKLKHSWKITKKKLTVSWKTEGKTEDGKTIYLPSLAFGSGMNVSVAYTYYKDDSFTQSITLKQIYDEFELTKVKTYYVKAKLNSSGGDYNSSNSVLLEGGTEKTEVTRIMQTGTYANEVSVTLDKSKVTFNGKEQEAIFQITGTSLDNIIISYFKADGTPLQKPPTNVGKYKVKVELKDTLTDYVLTGIAEFDFEVQSLRITKPPMPNQIQFFQIDGYGINDIVTLPSDWENYLIIKVIDKNNNEILPENGDWEFLNVGTYKIEISFKDNTNTSNGCDADNVIWSDSDKGTYYVNLEIKPLVLIVGDWQTSIDNKRPTMSGTDTTELEKYFDYMLYELKGDIIIGNALPQDSILKAGTNYQISLKVKDIYKGNVLVEYKGIEVAETEPFKFKTSSSSGIGGGDNNGNNGGGGIDGNGGSDNSNLWLGNCDGKIPLIVWLLIGLIALMILLFIIMIVVFASNNKNKERFDRVTPIASSTSDNNLINEFSDSNFANVNGKLMSDKDWTFIVREQDILNIKALENQTERVIMYACKESDIKKAKKFHNTIADVGRKELDNILGEEENSKPNKKKNRKKR